MYGVVVIDNPFSLQIFGQKCELLNVTINDIIQSTRGSSDKWFIFIDSVHQYELIHSSQSWDATVRFFTMEEICTRSIMLGLSHPAVFNLTNPQIQ